MSQTKFTPGPWLTQPMAELDGDNLRVTTDCGWEWEICHLCDGIDGDIGEIMAANARLIASAPEMFSIIEQLGQAINFAPTYWQEVLGAADISIDEIRQIISRVNQPSGANSQQ